MVDRFVLFEIVAEELERVNSQNEVLALDQSGTQQVEPIWILHPTKLSSSQNCF